MAGKGIPNCGNTCFMSASFQMLYSMEEFREKIMNTDWGGSEFNKADKTDIEKDKALKEIFTLMKDGKDWGTQTDTNTLGSYKEDLPRHKLIKAKTELIKLVKNDSNEVVDALGTQHDVTELINLLLDTINDVEKSNSKVVPISYFYKVKQESSTYCKVGSEVYSVDYQNVEEQNLINLSFNGKGNIEGSITEAEKEVNVDKLDRCDVLNELDEGNEYNPYSKITLTIPETNKYVIIALKRFEDQDNRVVDANFKVEHDLSIDKKKFSLIGAVLHGGKTRTSGHYIYQTYANGEVLNTYNDGLKVDGDGESGWDGKKMTLNLNSYVLLYRNDGVAAPATTPTEASSSTSPEATEATEAATQSPAQSPEEAPAQSPEEAVAASTEASTTSPAAPIAQQKGKGKIERVVLNDGDRYWIYEGFGLVKPKWVHNPKSSGGNKKSRKPKDKKIRLRKTRRRKH